MKLCPVPLTWPTSLQSRGTTVNIHSAISLRGKKQCHSSPEGWAMSQADFTFTHMLSSGFCSSSSLQAAVRLEREEQNVSIHAGSSLTTSEWFPKLCVVQAFRHPKCDCSWNTVKCFCSCRCPLKIQAASMTAVKISWALPFTCQQWLKIVQVASGGWTASLTWGFAIKI